MVTFVVCIICELTWIFCYGFFLNSFLPMSVFFLAAFGIPFCVNMIFYKKLPFNDKHVAYVWIDALLNYLSVLGYNTDNDQDYKDFWPCDVHIVGRDISRFHCIIWPILLKMLDLPLPKQIHYLRINGFCWLCLIHNNNHHRQSYHQLFQQMIRCLSPCNHFGKNTVSH